MHCTPGRSELSSIFLSREIENTEEAGERFAAAGWRSEEDRFASQNRGDATQLGIGEGSNMFRETNPPGVDEGG